MHFVSVRDDPQYTSVCFRWMFYLRCYSETFIDSLTLGDTFTVHNPCECQKNDDHAPGWASYLMHRLQAWTQQTLSLKPAFWSVGNSRRLSSHRSWWWISTWKPGQIDTEGGIFYLPKFETQGEIGLKKTSQELFKNASCVRSSPEVHKKTILSERWAQFKYDE